jgi:hypothetical protein
VPKHTLSPIGTPAAGTERVVSKGQKTFNELVQKIGKRREALADWAVFDAEFQRKYGNEFIPLLQQYNAVRIQLVTRLDQRHGGKDLTKIERRTMADLLIRVAGDLVHSVDDPAVADLYRRYQPVNPRAEAAMNKIPDALSAVFGDEKPEGVFAQPTDDGVHDAEPLDAHEERARAHRQARDEYHARRKKTPRHSTAEDRARAEQDEVNLSIREVYRKLASALHPDREADPVEGERKAALMQKINLAYGKKSLLDLLELQLELEHIDQASLDNVGEDRLRRWNVVLKEQLCRLDGELAEVRMGFQARCGMDLTRPVSTRDVKRSLTTQITAMREAIRAFERNLRLFDDPRRSKAWLKEVRWELAVTEDGDMMY